jgi:hypothetical protein
MNVHALLVVLFVMLALAGCVQVATGPGQEPCAPYSPENVHDRGGDGGTGGGGGGM